MSVVHGGMRALLCAGLLACGSPTPAPPAPPAGGQVIVEVDGSVLDTVDASAIRAIPSAYDRGEGHAVLAADLVGEAWPTAAVMIAEDAVGVGLFVRHPADRPPTDAIVVVVNKRGEVVLTTRAEDDRTGHGRGGERGRGRGLRVDGVARIALYREWPGG